MIKQSILATLLMFILFVALSWIVVIGFVWLISFCFIFDFTIRFGTGIWLCLLLLNTSLKITTKGGK